MADYREGQKLRGSDGNVYVVQGGVPTLASPGRPAAAPGGPVYGAPPKAPDPLDVGRYNIAVEDQTFQREKFGWEQADRSRDAQREEQRDQRTALKDNFDAAKTLRGDYNSDPRVKEFLAVTPSYVSALKTSPTSQGDMSLIYAFAKMMDPGSVVRESEFESAANTDTKFGQIVAGFRKQLGQGGMLRPEVRQQLRNEMIGRYDNILAGYNAARSEYGELSDSSGIDPLTVIRRNAGAPYADDLREVAAGMRGDDKALSGDRGAPQQGGHAYQQGDLPPAPGPLSEGVDDSALRAPPGEVFKRWAPNRDGTFYPVFGPPAEREEGRSGTGLDAFARGVGDTATLGFLDEARAITRTIGEGGTYNQNLADERAINETDTEQNFGARLGGQLVGGFALPTFGATGVKGMATVGGGYGAAYGAGSGESMPERGVNALLGGATGAGLGAGIAAVSPLIARGGAAGVRRFAGQTTPEQQAILRAGADEQVPVNMMDVFPGTRNTAATLETIPGASGPVRRGITAGRDAIEGRVQALGSGGSARENMGEGVVEAGKRYVQDSRAQADRLYTAARNQAQGVKIAPHNVKQTVARLARQEEEVPGGTAAGGVIRQYADAFESGTITIDGARKMRSELLRRLRQDGGLSKANATRITGEIMGAVNQDIEAGLVQAGKKGAVGAYRAADKFYAQRMDEIDSVIESVIGTDAAPKSPEQAMQRLRSLASPKGGDAAKLGRMVRHFSPEEKADFAATVASTLGRKSEKEPFSPADFISNVRQLSPQARRVIFGEEGERSIQNLLKLSEAKRDTVARLNNSRSGQVTNYRTVMASVLLGMPGGGAVLGMGMGLNGTTGVVGGAAIGGAGITVSRAIAKALLSEKFTRLVAQAPATNNPQAINAHIGRLRQLGVKDPNIRMAVVEIEKSLTNFANDNAVRTGSAAASPNERPESDK